MAYVDPCDCCSRRTECMARIKVVDEWGRLVYDVLCADEINMTAAQKHAVRVADWLKTHGKPATIRELQEALDLSHATLRDTLPEMLRAGTLYKRQLNASAPALYATRPIRDEEVPGYLERQQLIQSVRQMCEDGASSKEITQTLHVHSDVLKNIKRELFQA
jgi:predicted DNA-binding transcriptional regulator